MPPPESSVPKPRISRQCHNCKVNRQKGMWYWARAWTFEDGADLLIEVHDPIGEPHFHFLCANGDNIPISMLRPEYIKPTRHKLTAREWDAMLELFYQKRTFFSLAWLWNNQNMDCPWVTKFPGTPDSESSFVMPVDLTVPDYSLLEVEKEGEWEMYEPKELSELVCKLKKERNEGKQIRILQKIMEMLLTKYTIKLDDIIIEPLLLEAYYYDWPDKQNPPDESDRMGRFLDDNCHGASEQKDHPMKLYFHKTGYGGVDLCLSDGPYYLSFLIKCARVNNGPICSQTALYDTLYGHSSDIVLTARNTLLEHNHVVYNPRKGLSKTTYQSDPLAAILIDALKYKTVQQSLAKGYSKQWVLAQYAFRETNLDKNKVSSFLNKKGLYSGNIDKAIIDRLG